MSPLAPVGGVHEPNGIRALINARIALVGIEIAGPGMNVPVRAVILFRSRVPGLRRWAGRTGPSGRKKALRFFKDSVLAAAFSRCSLCLGGSDGFRILALHFRGDDTHFVKSHSFGTDVVLGKVLM